VHHCVTGDVVRGPAVCPIVSRPLRQHDLRASLAGVNMHMHISWPCIHAAMLCHCVHVGMCAFVCV